MGEGRKKISDAIINNPIKVGKKQDPEVINEKIMTIPIHLVVLMAEDPRQ